MRDPRVLNVGRNNGSGRRLKLRDLPTPMEKRTRDAPYTLSIEGFPDLIKRMEKDPTFAADIAHQLRRPKRVGRREHMISGRKAAQEPMLNAPRDTIERALAYREPTAKDRVAKGQLFEQFVVKPRCGEAAKQEYGAAFWGERLWNVYTLRWARGFVIVTDKGSESRTFLTMGELKSAIRKSGWDIIR